MRILNWNLKLLKFEDRCMEALLYVAAHKAAMFPAPPLLE
jgi:hypothetical protein